MSQVITHAFLQSVSATPSKHTFEKFTHAAECKQHQNNNHKNNVNSQIELIQETTTPSGKRKAHILNAAEREVWSLPSLIQRKCTLKEFKTAKAVQH